MALDTQLSAAAANAQANAFTALLNTGYLRIYSGTKPATVATAIGAQVLLAELRFGATAFGTASGGVSTANSITQDSSADASGTASWFRAFASDGTTAHWDGTVGTSGANLNMNSVAISSGAAVQVSSLTYTVNLATSGL